MLPTARAPRVRPPCQWRNTKSHLDITVLPPKLFNLLRYLCISYNETKKKCIFPILTKKIYQFLFSLPLDASDGSDALERIGSILLGSTTGRTTELSKKERTNSNASTSFSFRTRQQNIRKCSLNFSRILFCSVTQKILKILIFYRTYLPNE